ncbi:hypothetical protein H072_1293 [Dactylellina haptotyla CBS 200.50]|uniref:Extracellular serine-rich protein n=1 Tax=Dactylellina haptotyla (strain CBS 200.50) TaxID=1284197 RepID=S8APB8_DACHA|nr:hypothetical protein H072_1293 [Dactylellina haptotyla CBS 200.50]
MVVANTTARFSALLFILLSTLFSYTHGIAVKIRNTALIVTPDMANAATVTGTMDGYGIPYEVLIVPQSGVTMPQLNQTNGDGNYGLFLVISQVSYNYGDAWRSALTNDQWNLMYDYQTIYGVRMIHINAFPSGQFGASALGGCCNAGDDQTVTVDKGVAAEQFPTAGLKFPSIKMTGLWHYPAKIADSSSTICFMTFGANAQYTSTSCGGVINTFNNGRQQMVFFTSFGTWSAVSNYLNHVWINWGLFGLYAGYRRVLFDTQIDDLFLPSAIYGTNGGTFRLRPSDVSEHLTWQADLNTRLVSGGNAGSAYFIEFGFNGNGNFIYTQTIGVGKTCSPPVTFVRAEEVTPLEYQKILGTGTDMWPPNSTFDWTLACMKKDPLVAQFMDKTVRDAFGLMSHTFTHLGENPITYDDAFREITFNQNFAKLATFDKAAKWSGKGLIPPAITGLHNGDAIRAWSAAGLTSCVGDNTRAPLQSPFNAYWPFITNISSNGFDGFTVIPRFASRIYFNCDTANCTLSEWINTSAGAGDIFDLLNLERASTAKNLLALRQDPYMFHQANLRWYDVDVLTINGNSQRWSLLQMWVESVLNEFTQYVNWPIITKKHDDVATAFMQRMARDQCGYNITWNTSTDQKTIVGFTVGSGTTNKCSVPIPVTIPVGNSITNVGSYKTEQIGNDPLTLWVTLSGAVKTFTLTTPIKLTAAGGAGPISSFKITTTTTTKKTSSMSATAASTTSATQPGTSSTSPSTMATSTSPATTSSPLDAAGGSSSTSPAAVTTSTTASSLDAAAVAGQTTTPAVTDVAVSPGSGGSATDGQTSTTGDSPANRIRRNVDEDQEFHIRHQRRRRHMRM